jgi:hypothetical protein
VPHEAGIDFTAGRARKRSSIEGAAIAGSMPRLRAAESRDKGIMANVSGVTASGFIIAQPPRVTRA